MWKLILKHEDSLLKCKFLRPLLENSPDLDIEIDTYQIYVLVSLHTNSWYIGVTRWNILKRYQKHMYEARKKIEEQDRKYLVMKKEGIHNFVMIPIQYASRNTYKALEARFIELFQPPLNSDKFLDFKSKRKFFDNQKRRKNWKRRRTRKERNVKSNVAFYPQIEDKKDKNPKETKNNFGLSNPFIKYESQESREPKKWLVEGMLTENLGEKLMSLEDNSNVLISFQRR